MTDKRDFYRIIFLTICKHLAITVATFFASRVLESHFTYHASECTYIGLIITNCTGIIMGKLNRILERLPREESI